MSDESSDTPFIAPSVLGDPASGVVTPPISKVNWTHAAEQAELTELEKTRHHVEVTADTAGVEAEIAADKNGWGIAAFVRRLWTGQTSAGGRVRKEW